MASRYVEIESDSFCEALAFKGFKRDQNAGNEIVYVRQHHYDPTMYVKIYTSIPATSSVGRACGQDAIRVVLIFKNDVTGRSGGLWKAPRVYRTGSQEKILDRTIERAREAYAEANKRVKNRGK